MTREPAPTPSATVGRHGPPEPYQRRVSDARLAEMIEDNAAWYNPRRYESAPDFGVVPDSVKALLDLRDELARNDRLTRAVEKARAERRYKRAKQRKRRALVQEAASREAEDRSPRADIVLSAKHSPGPWIRCTHLTNEPCGCEGRGPRAFIYSKTGDVAICYVDELGRGGEQGADMTPQPSRAEALANAALIAAAPDLLAAAQRIEAAPYGVALGDIAALQAAIRKALGAVTADDGDRGTR